MLIAALVVSMIAFVIAVVTLLDLSPQFFRGNKER